MILLLLLLLLPQSNTFPLLCKVGWIAKTQKPKTANLANIINALFDQWSQVHWEAWFQGGDNIQQETDAGTNNLGADSVKRYQINL